MMESIVVKLGRLLFLVRRTADNPDLWELPMQKDEVPGCRLGKAVLFKQEGGLVCYEARIKCSRTASRHRFGQPERICVGRPIVYRLVSADNVLGHRIPGHIKRIAVTDETKRIIKQLYAAGHLLGVTRFFNI